MNIDPELLKGLPPEMVEALRRGRGESSGTPAVDAGPSRVVKPVPSKGVRCNVLRPAYAYDEMLEAGMWGSGHLSDSVMEVTLCGDGIPEKHDPTDKAPALILIRRELSHGEYLHAQPPEPAGGSYAFGGNYAYSWDFLPVCKYPIPIHDHLGPSV